MLVELTIVQQRYDAVKEVLVSEVASRYGVDRDYSMGISSKRLVMSTPRPLCTAFAIQ
jgi:hypothetical protein